MLIIGDLMLDHFVIGRVDRISPEAPVPVVQFDHEEYRLGGAANVAHNVAALGGRVEMIGVAGDDADAGRGCASNWPGSTSTPAASSPTRAAARHASCAS